MCQRQLRTLRQRRAHRPRMSRRRLTGRPQRIAQCQQQLRGDPRGRRRRASRCPPKGCDLGMPQRQLKALRRRWGVRRQLGRRPRTLRCPLKGCRLRMSQRPLKGRLGMYQPKVRHHRRAPMSRRRLMYHYLTTSTVASAPGSQRQSIPAGVAWRYIHSRRQRIRQWRLARLRSRMDGADDALRKLISLRT